MKDQTFSDKHPLLIIAFLQDFKEVCDACNIHESTAIWLSRQYLTGPVEPVIKALVALPTESAKSKEGGITLFSANVIFLIPTFKTNDNITAVGSDISKAKKGSLTGTDCAQPLWARTSRLGSFYHEEIVKGPFVGGLRRTNCLTPRQCRS